MMNPNFFSARGRLSPAAEKASSPLHKWRGAGGEAAFDVALARTEGVGRRDSDPDSLGSHRRKAPHGSPDRLGSAESPAEARRVAPFRVPPGTPSI